MPLTPGARLGAYEILSPLGAGGMGEVWRARDARLGREVAVKVLPAEVADDASRLKRFEREARAASALNHPNIVTIYDIGSFESTSYIAMERVDGKTLREALLPGALPLKRLLPIAAQIADGLARAHEAGIVHRDLKPENVMVTKDGLVKILDFGLAKRTQSGSGSDEASHLPTETGTSPGMVLGTVGYMSPEQAAGQPLDFRSDQFAFGSILYEMAAGRRAFQGKTAVDTLSAILNEEPEPVGRVAPQAPVPLRWIVERCLEKDPGRRYASTRDLARDLVMIRDHLSDASAPAAPAAAPSTGIRMRLRAALLALLAAILVGALASRPYWKSAFSSQPTIRQITFRRAVINDARFAPDGQVVYSARGNDPFADLGELFSVKPGTPEPRALGLPANVLAVSASGELAILVNGAPGIGTLATVSLAGGAPRELLERVRRADWAPDGKGLAVVHAVKPAPRLEYPIGKVLFESKGWVGDIQFSPRGDWIALADNPAWVPGTRIRRDLTLVDRAGKVRRVGSVPWEFRWSPRGDELWFNRIEGGTTEIHAMALSGRTRLLASFTGEFGLEDVARDGRALLVKITKEFEIVGHVSGETGERNLSWLDGSVPADLSSDGKTLLFNEMAEGGGLDHAVYLRRTDGSAAVRLGQGRAHALSPDGRWALVSPDSQADHLVLLPTGPGQPRKIPLSGMRLVGAGAKFFPDGKRILIRGRETDRSSRLYVLDIESGKARAFTPERIPIEAEIHISPDGRQVVSSIDAEDTFIYDVEGGPPQPVPAVPRTDYAIRWCADGKSLFVRTTSTDPIKVYRLSLATGRREPWREFSITDIGAERGAVLPTPDGSSYVYSYVRHFSDLFIAEGLK